MNESGKSEMTSSNQRTRDTATVDKAEDFREPEDRVVCYWLHRKQANSSRGQ